MFIPGVGPAGHIYTPLLLSIHAHFGLDYTFSNPGTLCIVWPSNTRVNGVAGGIEENMSIIPL